MRVRTPKADALTTAVAGGRRPGAVNGDGALLVTGVDAPAVGAAALRSGVELHELTTERPDLEDGLLPS